MKKFIACWLVVAMVLGIYGTAFGAKSENDTIEVVDGPTKEKQTVYVANLLMGGKDIITDVPTMIYKDRSLVPIAFVVDHLGGKIDWDQEKYTATILWKDKTIVLKIDSAIAYVDGKKASLPDGVPAKLISYKGNYRTMVPLRFISEQLGLDVNWINDTRTATVDLPQQVITGVSYYEKKGSSEIHIQTTGEVRFTSMYLQGSKIGGSDRIVVDIPNTILEMKATSIVDEQGLMKKEIGKDGVRAVRGSIFEPEPRSVSRIVVDLDKKKEYNIKFDQESDKIILQIFNPLNTVESIKMEKRNFVDAVVIHTNDEPLYNVMDLGDRVVVDVMNAQLKGNASEIPVGRGGIKRIRTAPFAPDQNYEPDDKIVRVVVDLQEGESMDDVMIEVDNQDVLVYVDKKPLKGFIYQKETYNRSKLQLSLDDRANFDIDYDRTDHLLEIEIPKNKVDWESAKLDISDKIIEDIEIEDDTKDRYYLVRLKLAEGTTYQVDTKEDETDQILVNFENKELEASRFYGKVVVLDAGHGGKDPGASGVKLGLKEKEIALDVVQRLNKLLQEAGFTTALTRDDDTYIGLYDRPAIANELNADTFVSVHFNWHPDPSITGIQMLYNASNPNKDSKTFAKIIQEETLKATDATDRRIVERPNLVVIRETNMPAVLAELAFISNQAEEQLASTPEYRQKLAQGLFNGITRYFDEVILK